MYNAFAFYKMLVLILIEFGVCSILNDLVKVGKLELCENLVCAHLLYDDLNIGNIFFFFFLIDEIWT